MEGKKKRYINLKKNTLLLKVILGFLIDKDT